VHGLNLNIEDIISSTMCLIIKAAGMILIGTLFLL
jgi:hypothetical protein